MEVRLPSPGDLDASSKPIAERSFNILLASKRYSLRGSGEDT